jgi:hypothetical protein
MRAILAGLCAASGCRAHVQLAAPPAGAPEADRVAAYERLRPTGVGMEYGRHHALVDSHVELGDGTRVGYAADLEPVVLPASQTAAYAAHADAARTHTRRWVAVVMGLFAATMAAGPIEAATMRVGWRQLETIGGTYLVGSLLIWGAYRQLGPASLDAFDAQAAAFDGYDADLRARLDVCVEGLRVAACDR